MPPRRQLCAFTIVELLVASSITIGIVVLLGIIFGSITKTTTRANQRTDAFRDARAALQMMQRDFSALVHATPAAYFAIDTDNAGQDVRQLSGLISIKNRAAANASAIVGDTCAVRYYCAWANNAYTLHRYFRDSSLTFQTFQSKLASTAPFALNYTNTASLYNASGATDEIVAANVWNLQIIAYDSAGNVINSQSDVFGVPTTGAPYICVPPTGSNALPAAIEISFNAMSSNAARTLVAMGANSSVWMVTDNASPSSSDQQNYQNLILPNTYRFRARISLH